MPWPDDHRGPTWTDEEQKRYFAKEKAKKRQQLRKILREMCQLILELTDDKEAPNE